MGYFINELILNIRDNSSSLMEKEIITGDKLYEIAILNSFAKRSS